MSDEIVKRAEVLPSLEPTHRLSKHDEGMQKLAARKDLELLKMGGQLLQIAGKVIQSRARRDEIVEKQTLVEKEIERIEAEHAKSKTELDAHRGRLESAAQRLPDAIRKDLPLLLELLGDVSPSDKAQIVQSFLAKIPSVEIKV